MAIKFHAHSVGALMSDKQGSKLTDKQNEKLKGYLARRGGDGRPLTDNQNAECNELIAKRDAPFEFGAVAQDYIWDCWLENERGYREVLLTHEIRKGLICEDQAIGVLSRQLPGGFRVKNDATWSDDDFIGTPDVVLDDCIEDVKCSWTIKSHVRKLRAKSVDNLYYAQAQVYMSLTGITHFRLCHVLLDTPEVIVIELKKRAYFDSDCDEDDPRYLEAIAAIDSQHIVSDLPEEQRIHVVPIEYNEAYMLKLRKRVALAREFYATLSLKGES